MENGKENSFTDSLLVKIDNLIFRIDNGSVQDEEANKLFDLIYNELKLF